MAADSVTPDVRSRMMAGIRGKNTKPELAMRSALHRRGFRFRLHCKELPGKPDLVFRKFRAVIFVHGCFWHGHGCHLFKWPKTRSEFWQQKIHSNIDRDRRQRLALISAGVARGNYLGVRPKGTHKRERRRGCREMRDVAGIQSKRTEAER